MSYRAKLKSGLLSATMLTSVALAFPALAQEEPDAAADQGNEIIVTATRRDTSLQDVPINISAIGEQALERQRLDDVADIAAFTPGLTVADTGPRSANSVVLRGITSEGANNSNGNFGAEGANAIGIYLGEIPLYTDFKFLDISRVETLLGPQGTLYGLGTLAGAVRYIPNRPNFTDWSGEVHLRYYDVAHSSAPGVQGDATINIPIVADKIALRATAGYYNDPGFIDYPFVVRQLGVSLPQPDFTDPAAVRANLRNAKDLNNEVTFAARVQVGFDFGWLRPTFSYIRQRTISDGDQSNGAFGARYRNGPNGVQFPEGECVYAGCRGVLGTGKYQNPSRVEEPSDRRLDLFALEIEADLGDVAQLVSASAYSKQDLFAQSDIADLLLDLNYDYELFPAFAGFTQSSSDLEQFNQEVRVVSTHGGPFSWVVGGFFNQFKSYTFSAETLPGFPEFAASPTGSATYGGFYNGLIRPDGIEYISFVDSKTTEYAAFGEATFRITPAFQITGGVRYYKFDAEITGGTDTPLTPGGRRRTPFPLVQFDPSRIRSGETGDDGFVYKANASYEFNPGLLLYATYSTGYRIGGANRVAPCIIPLPPGQNVCALPNELFYGSDKTENYEVGVRFNLLDSMVSGTVNIYQIDWKDLQLDSQTQNGAVGIRTNAAAARNRGLEATLNFKFDRFTVSGNYTYLDAKLTESSRDLIGGINDLFLADLNGDGDPRDAAGFTEDTVDDGFKGDRLPGTSKHAGSVTATYTLPMANDAELTLLWNTQLRSSTLSKTGMRGYGEKIPGFTVSRASITYQRDRYEFSIFSSNIFDKYARNTVQTDFTSARSEDGVIIREYQYGVIPPRSIGAEFRVRF